MDNYLKDIQDIKEMMNRSSQFLSLSGLSGILAGVYALAGAYAVHCIAEEHYTLESKTFKQIVFIALAVLVLSVTTAIILTYKKTRKDGETMWNATSKRLLLNFLIPLCTGGIFGLLLLKNGYYGIIAPVMLIFYGLSLINASKYTVRDVRYLGMIIVVIGLFSTAYMGYGLEFWALGFGVCHIIYGTFMHFKYDRKQ
ncbi:hypothetical protein [Flavobacterium beibuense]|uniref:Brp/Blh family beta-carotene 15,15'-monooxygenase n=1 Tax=Flavobacterium beibuense TaxID=657326 RepID=A0A444WET6_9FLAO|nr:hypothetical protein [Flavobacterium beibuense]RYJ44337.1 Brp/Blh family beta-carotene 15,15'-monooxygenase [Flavobacterium beibuense]